MNAFISCNGPVSTGAFVSMTHNNDFYGIKYKSAQCGHIESINNGFAVIDWHHGVAPKQKISIAFIKNCLPVS